MASHALAGKPATPSWLGRDAKPSALDHAPALIDAMGRVAEAWIARFVELSGTPIEMRCLGLRLDTITHALQANADAPTCAMLCAPEWSASVGLTLDRTVVTILVEALFGGDGGEADAMPSGALSPIETQIVDLFGQQFAEAVGTGLAPDVRFELRYENRLAKPDFGPLGKGEQLVGIVGLSLSGLGRTGHFELFLPQTVLDSLVDRLDAEADHLPAEHDPRWSRQLGDEVGRATAALQATMELPPMSLGALLGLKTGQVLTFPSTAAGRVKLSCGASPLFRCELGQIAGHYTVRIDDTLADGSGTSSILTASP